ncbi:uncharacterized protein [Lepisosteus oculatus]|uniref:uncharacterized protein n=1 Tax=Lepisosteus oculatus TaxID=7918 RepID=UPI00371419E7
MVFQWIRSSLGSFTKFRPIQDILGKFTVIRHAQDFLDNFPFHLDGRRCAELTHQLVIQVFQHIQVILSKFRVFQWIRSSLGSFTKFRPIQDILGKFTVIRHAQDFLDNFPFHLDGRRCAELTHQLVIQVFQHIQVILSKFRVFQWIRSSLGSFTKFRPIQDILGKFTVIRHAQDFLDNFPFHLDGRRCAELTHQLVIQVFQHIQVILSKFRVFQWIRSSLGSFTKFRPIQDILGKFTVIRHAQDFLDNFPFHLDGRRCAELTHQLVIQVFQHIQVILSKFRVFQWIRSSLGSFTKFRPIQDILGKFTVIRHAQDFLDNFPFHLDGRRCAELTHQLVIQVSQYIQVILSKFRVFQPIQDFIDSFKEGFESTMVRRAMEVEVTLDTKTINPYLMVSEDGRELRWTDQRQNLPDNPERFDEYPCVLGNRLPAGRRCGCYWEVEVGNKTSWELGVARGSVCRKGQLSLSPGAGFWVLSLWDGKLTALTDPETPLNTKIPTRVGIHVDYEKERVHFYNVKADVYSVIYTFADKIDRDVQPFFSPGNNDEDPLYINH